MKTISRGLYFEEFGNDFEIRSVGRTITETDVVSFAGLSGDYNQIHTDDVLATNSMFGQRVAHGMLILSIASGLAVQTGILEGTIMAFREIDNWKFSTPVYFGETIYVELKVIETKHFPRLGGGTVKLKVTVKKQTGEAVNKGNWTMLVKSKPIN